MGTSAGLDREPKLLGPAVAVVDCGPEGLFLGLMLKNGDVLSLGLASGQGILGHVFEPDVVAGRPIGLFDEASVCSVKLMWAGSEPGSGRMISSLVIGSRVSRSRISRFSGPKPLNSSRVLEISQVGISQVELRSRVSYSAPASLLSASLPSGLSGAEPEGAPVPHDFTVAVVAISR
jgi:hypothetical protein